MKAAFFNPYLDTLGGGERYTTAFAQVLLKAGYRVDFQWNNSEIVKKLEDRFGIKLPGINLVNDVKRGDGYDVCFWVSDGSVPLLRARKNFLHFQIPFKNIGGKSLINKMKFFRINKVICNSKFTKAIIDKEFGIKSIVLYPPVDVVRIKPKKKQNLILAIGRFSQLTQSKHQDVLIKAFKKLFDSGVKSWKLILAGGVEIGVDDYVAKLKESSAGYPIEIIESPKFRLVKDLYGQAKIFWSASGYKEDEKKNPKKVEHFGISVVEAMSAGAVPIVFLAGGHREIIKDGENGYLWRKKSELMQRTKKLISDQQLLKSMSKGVRLDAKNYGYERFDQEVAKLL